VTTFQTISGTGAVHLGALFLAKFHPQNPKPQIYLSNPTWANHNQIFTNVGLSLATYPYFDPKTKGLNFDGMLNGIRDAPTGSVILLHACAHNPTGVDLTQEQWKEIAAVMRERHHFPFFDTAYQGFASGDLNRDAWAVRYFIEQGFELCVAQSFAKNFGLYGQRAGAFHFVSAPGATAKDDNAHVSSQLAILQRSEISNPPAYGAQIASRILNDPTLFAEWEEDLRTMSGRIAEMRKGLRQRLEAKGTPGTWNHVTDQIGMFSFTGLTEAQVKLLREKWHIYMVGSPLLILRFTPVIGPDTRPGSTSVVGDITTLRLDYEANQNYRPRTGESRWPASTQITLITSQRQSTALFGRRRKSSPLCFFFLLDDFMYGIQIATTYSLINIDQVSASLVNIIVWNSISTAC
jgi:aspartate aminotransferase